MSFEQIAVEQARELIQNGNITVVDIRDGESYAEGHIANSISLTNHNAAQFVESADRNKPVICYCYHGFSSQTAASFLAEKGFTKVYSLTGGFEEWRMNYPDEVVAGA